MVNSFDHPGVLSLPFPLPLPGNVMAEARGDVEQRIVGCPDLEQLKAWIRRATHVSNAAELESQAAG